jgi:hypothetical protein
MRMPCRFCESIWENVDVPIDLENNKIMCLEMDII